ncbi:hypothetical protein TNCV_1855261 [Trichonephila clavipes]|nr:hypothetical protein TNCV_1855261 [Trichonephila clavipes]
MKHGYPISHQNQSNSLWNGWTHPFSSKSKPNKHYQDNGNSFLGLAWCFAGGLYAPRNNDQLRCLLSNFTEAPKSIAKQTAQHAVNRFFTPPQ